jgi:hypothetical protein
MYRSLRTNRESRATLRVQGYDHARYEQIGGKGIITCEDGIMYMIYLERVCYAHALLLLLATMVL